MSLTIEQLKSAFKQNDNKDNANFSNSYPFWKMDFDKQVVVRFLPDLNEDNPMLFLLEKTTHRLVINEKYNTIPCFGMYGEDCPICQLSRSYYKDGDKTNGKKYWKTKHYLAQVIIVEDPLSSDDSDETYEGRVMSLSMGGQIFNVIKESIESGELDDLPFAFKDGCDFIIKKSKQGDYANYGIGTKFSRKTRDLSEEEIELANEHSIDLSTLIPKKMDRDKVMAMLEASLNNSDYSEDSDEDKVEEVVEVKASKPKSSSKTVVQEVVADTSDNDDESDESSDEFEDEADRILAQIRNRKKNKL